MMGERMGSVGHTRGEGFLRGWELTKELGNVFVGGRYKIRCWVRGRGP